jgi:hypothetical protein
MKLVDWTDERGYRRRSMIRDNDPDEMAPDGIPQEPPDIDSLDWDFLKRELHNTLMDQGLHTWEDVVQRQTGVTSAILKVFKRPLVQIYRERR